MRDECGAIRVLRELMCAAIYVYTFYTLVTLYQSGEWLRYD